MKLWIRDNHKEYGTPINSYTRFAVFTNPDGVEGNPQEYVPAHLFNEMKEFIENCMTWGTSRVDFTRHEILKKLEELENEN